mgnify:CR=1 FL=1
MAGQGIDAGLSAGVAWRKAVERQVAVVRGLVRVAQQQRPLAAALFLLADRNGDAVLEMAEWGLTGEIRLQQQAEMQEYAALLRAQRLGAELNYPDSWQMLLALLSRSKS